MIAASIYRHGNDGNSGRHETFNYDTCIPNAATMAIIVATSTDAEDETPLPSGTSEEMMMERLSSTLRPSSRARTSRQPTT
jgi:hypothetical protein